MSVANWNDVETHRRAKGEMDATWQRLGDAAGIERVGVNRVRVAPNMLSTPPHSHGASEEIFYVLNGSGLAWQDGAVHQIRAGHCLVYRANELEHTIRGGPEGIEYLVFGTRHPTEVGWLPRSGALRTGWAWVEARDDDPWDVEATVEPLAIGDPAGAAPNIVHFDDAPHEVEGSEEWRELAAAAGSKQAGLNWVRLGAGRAGPPPHCHSEEEEVFVVLDGGATLELWPSPRPDAGAERETVDVGPGDVIARPAGTRVSHFFRAGAEGATMLVYGTRHRNDIVYYPRSNKIFWRGIGLIGRVEPLEYFDGEPRE